MPVFAEPRLAVLSVDHPLAAKASVRLDDLADLPLLQDPAAVPELLGTRTAAAARRVAIERGFVILPESTARLYMLLPVDGLGPSEVALVAVDGVRSEVVEAALAIARAEAEDGRAAA